MYFVLDSFPITIESWWVETNSFHVIYNLDFKLKKSPNFLTALFTYSKNSRKPKYNLKISLQPVHSMLSDLDKAEQCKAVSFQMIQWETISSAGALDQNLSDDN